MTTMHRANGKSGPATTELSSGSPEVAGGGFTRLNPVDGLFLRAEHLQVMQNYAADLAAAVGAGLGPGVVYGYTCTLADDAVQVSGGLAFADGRPLRSSQGAGISLEGLGTGSDRDFWIVEIVPTSWQFGSEPVYGGLCEDPCGNGSGIRPTEAEGVEVRLRHDSLDKASPGPDQLRNWLASFYFERERRYGGEFAPSANAPWLLPTSPGAKVPDVQRGHRWDEDTGAHEAVAVPLAVVWKKGSRWKLDTWIARRDLGEPRPAAAWQGRLGWRPRNVFVAQVLQFQEQLAASTFGSALGLSAELKWLESKAALQFEFLHRIADLVKDPSASRGVTKAAESVSAALAAANLVEQGSWLRAAGFGELPPAGYLTFAIGPQQDMEFRAGQIFGDLVEVNVRACRADYIAHAVEQVQHMDRIPLDAPLGVKAKIDLLVPDTRLGDLAATQPGSPYGWAAFVRRREEPVEPAYQDVDVYVVRSPENIEGTLSLPRLLSITGLRDAQTLVGKIRAADRRDNDFEFVGKVRYPLDGWALPIDQADAWHMVRDALNRDTRILAVLGVARWPYRLPLAAVRASLFVTPTKDVNDDAVRLPTTYVLAADAPEAVVVVVSSDPVIR